MGILLSWALLSTTADAAPGVGSAVSSFETDQVKVQLVASSPDVHAGGRVTIGLHQRIIAHWHTYWVNPGDSGAATTITWHLPRGSKASEIQWPIPSRYSVGPVTNFGYADAVTLLSDILVPTTLQPGEVFTATADADWLVCADVCIPQKARLSLNLAVVAPSQTLGAGSPLITQARSQLPDMAPAWSAQASLMGKQQLTIDVPAAARTAGSTLKEAWFYPLDWGRIQHSAPQALDASTEAQGTRLLIRTGEAAPAAGQPLPGVLVLTETLDGRQMRKGFQISPVVVLAPSTTPTAAPPTAASTAASTAESTAHTEADITWLAALALAFVGGLILNLMPCVFPVLSIKALAMLSHSEQGAAQTRLQGLAYTAGVLASFALLAALLLALKAGGTQVGWGFQFQSPLFVLVVAYLMLAVGLNLSGAYTIGGSLTGMGSSLAARDGYSGSFFTGVLATVVATPCTAPFMGGAIGFALGQPAAVVLTVFLSLGLGLAAPYLLLSCWPALQHRLPRPGAWMERFKQFLAFPMYATAAWLVWVLAQQAGVNAAGAALLGMVAIGFAAWVYDSSRQGSPRVRLAGTALAITALGTAMVGGHTSLDEGVPGASGTNGIGPQATANQQAWQPYSPSRLDTLRAQGSPVFVNMTAAWCITCLANERVALSQATVAEAFKVRGIHYLKGDWTRQDPDITRLLSQFGRSGVPLYIYYPPGAQSKPVVLPQILTPDIVIQAINPSLTTPE